MKSIRVFRAQTAARSALAAGRVVRAARVREHADARTPTGETPRVSRPLDGLIEGLLIDAQSSYD